MFLYVVVFIEGLGDVEKGSVNFVMESWHPRIEKPINVNACCEHGAF